MCVCAPMCIFYKLKDNILTFNLSCFFSIHLKRLEVSEGGGHMANKGNSAQGRENSKSKSTKLGTCLACSGEMEVDNIAAADRLREREKCKRVAS